MYTYTYVYVIIDVYKYTGEFVPSPSETPLELLS